MHRITKLALVVGAPAALAAVILGTAGSASAAVAVNNGVGAIGKGDVQTALGYKNDAAFQADAKNITFSVGSDVTNFYADIKCSDLNVMGPDDPFDAVHNLMGVSSTTTRTPVVAADKNPQGKVVGYTASGIVSGTPQAGSIDWSLWSKCPMGEHFMGWLNGPANAFHSETVQGGSTLTVSNGVKTVVLPNTPAV